MLWNLTYADPDRWKEVHAIAGEALPWWKRSGSPRMQLVEGPPPVATLLEETSDVKWANLQRTQQGGIVYFRVRLEVYGVPCAAGSTTWRMDDKSLTLTHPEGPMRFVLSSAPSKGLLALLEAAFGPETVSKVHA